MTAFPLVLTVGDVPLAATVHRDTDDPFVRQPAVLVTGSWLTVKEQMPDLYAGLLSERGFTAVTFDFGGFGASGGVPRQAELPSRKIAELAAVARAVGRLSFVRPGPVGQLAVCASAQYALAAIAGGAPIGALVAVAGWFHDTETVAPFYGGADGVRARLGWARDATAAFLATGEVRTVPAYRAGDERAGMSQPLDYYADPGRGAVATWVNAMAELSWEHWLGFDGLSPAADVTAPTLLVHSDGCVLPDNARAVHDRLAGPKELVWSADGTQTDFYDRPDQVSLAVEAADRHFRRTL